MLARLLFVLSIACKPETSEGSPDDLGSLTVAVLDRGAGDAPVADVPCALDAPGGGRAEGVTGADGTVRFDAVDWSLGTASAVCVTDVGAVAYAGFTGEGDERISWPLSFGGGGEAPPVVSVSGAIGSPQSADDLFLVQTTAGPGVHQDFGVDYALDVYADAPFDLLATEVALGYNPAPHGISQEIVGWAVAPSDALTADATIGIDLVADAVTPVEVAGTIALPASDAFQAPDVFGAFYVTPGDPAYYFQHLVGFVTSSAYTDDGRLTFEGEAIPDLYADEEVVTVFILGGSTLASYLVMPGYPPSGDLEDELLDVPDLVGLPEYPTLETPLAWDPAGTQPLQVTFFDQAGQTYLVQWPAGAAGVTVPALPTGAELFSGSRVVGEFLAVEGQVGALYERLSLLDVTFYL